MTYVALSGGAYQSRSIIAGAQRCLNLYPEYNPVPQSEANATHYPTPGLRFLGNIGFPAPCRGLYRATNGNLYAAFGQILYAVDRNWFPTSLARLSLNRSGMVYMADNGTQMVVVDGSSAGWAVDISNNATTLIVDPAFYGADRVDYIDTFFVFSKPGTPQFYASNSLELTFDPLYFADKTGSPDNVVSIVTSSRYIWLIGELTTEVFFNAGSPAFPFQSLPGAFIEHGCCAKYSVAKHGGAIWWISQDREGRGIVVEAGVGVGFHPARISTHAIEEEIASYSTIADAIGFAYQQSGHLFYQLTFPSANKTWVYDKTTSTSAQSPIWHQRAYVDGDGEETEHRAVACALAYDTMVVGDRENGSLYALDESVYTDNGQPIKRVRSWPHMASDGKRVMYQRFVADMEVGGLPDVQAQASLRWSDDRGVTWGNPVIQSMGDTGQYITSMQWQRLGLARSRVFELSWSANRKTALNGAYIDFAQAGA